MRGEGEASENVGNSADDRGKENNTRMFENGE